MTNRTNLEELPGLAKALRAVRVCPKSNSFPARKSTPHDLCIKAADTLESLAAENRTLRNIISQLGYCTPDASLEFMALIPAEILDARKALSGGSEG